MECGQRDSGESHYQRSSEQEILLTTFREEDVLTTSAEATARVKSNRCIVSKGGTPE